LRSLASAFGQGLKSGSDFSARAFEPSFANLARQTRNVSTHLLIFIFRAEKRTAQVSAHPKPALLAVIMLVITQAEVVKETAGILPLLIYSVVGAYGCNMLRVSVEKKFVFAPKFIEYRRNQKVRKPSLGYFCPKKNNTKTFH